MGTESSKKRSLWREIADWWYRPNARERVLYTMKADGREFWLGRELHDAAAIGWGSVYLVLRRLEEAGFVTSEPAGDGMGRRRYRLTNSGRREAGKLGVWVVGDSWSGSRRLRAVNAPHEHRHLRLVLTLTALSEATTPERWLEFDELCEKLGGTRDQIGDEVDDLLAELVIKGQAEREPGDSLRVRRALKNGRPA